MSYVQKVSVAIVTATDGSFTGYSDRVTGRVSAVRYVKDGTAPLASTADLTITSEDIGTSLWTDTNLNASETVLPMAIGNLNTSGAALATTLPRVPIYMANDRVKVVVAQGGNTKVGTVVVVVA